MHSQRNYNPSLVNELFEADTLEKVKVSGNKIIESIEDMFISNEGSSDQTAYEPVLSRTLNRLEDLELENKRYSKNAKHLNTN